MHGLPAAPVVALAASAEALPDGADGVSVWLVSDERVWRLDLRRADGVLSIGRAARVEVPGRPASQRAVDVRVGVGGDRMVVLYERAIARALDAGPGALRFEVVHPALLPGASASRIAVAGGHVFVATDQGLLRASRWPDRWQRAAPPAGGASTVAVAGGPGSVFALGPQGLLMAEPEPAAPAPRAARTRALPIDPALALVHAKALERAGLDPAYFRGLRSRLGRRGWLPDVSLRAGAAYDSDSGRDYDETFTSGALRRLNDRYGARSRDFDAALTLSWDLGDVVYHPDAPELSREARQVVALRDNVLDEINQLYFDRRRALVALAAFADRRDPEAVALEIRCRELAAGLDAWTGGWFSTQIREPARE